MLVLITYDVNTSDAEGRKRLRKVAKQCQNYGQRVQNSVFECLIDTAQLKLLRTSLIDIIDAEKDSLRFYFLGTKYQTKIEHVGAKESYEPEGVLIL
ncbi:MAG: CRISPR-associated endonuclease Cas2 [Anaerovoracaceae bacterium]